MVCFNLRFLSVIVFGQLQFSLYIYIDIAGWSV